MNEVASAETVKKLTAPFLEKGFAFEYFHQKGGDSSCVYVYRFKKGKDFFDWREVSGSTEMHLVVCVDGEYKFPAIEKAYKKRVRAFSWKHLFKKPTMDERREMFAEILLTEFLSGKPDFYGIKLKDSLK